MLNESLSKDFSSSYDSFVYDCLRPYGIYMVAYFIFAIPFMIIDLMGCPERFRKYKVQPTENLSVTFDQVKKCFFVVMFNFIIVGFPCECLIYYIRLWRGCHDQTVSEWPWLIVLTFQLVIMVPMFNIIFFYSHYFLHAAPLYKYFHKMHHEWKAPISIASYYTHPVDHFFTNWLDIAVPPLLIGANSTTITFWYIQLVFVIVWHHCGYKLPFGPDPEFHDFHHENFTKNYGSSSFDILDRLHGTLAIEKKKNE